MSVVHFLRHGEVYNPERVLYGRLPGFRLSDRGVEQAELAAKFLADRDVVAIVSSPLERARQTAAPLAAALNLDVGLDDRLIEAENVFEGRQVAGGKGLAREFAKWRHLYNPLRPSWGEPYAQIASRMTGALQAAAVLAGEHEAVCVSHQLPIVSLRRSVEGQRLFHDPRRRECGLGSVTSFTILDSIVVAVDYAEPAGATPKGSVGGA
ncbi:MAG: histidine phosphatase family protein [Actinobacteria bacterium]|nr:histidine phosphatase family protein [Actinomycetota bacterium]